MVRGYISGMFFGLLAGGVLLGAASLLSELPSSVASPPNATEVEVPGGSEFDQAKPDATPIVPDSDQGPGTREVAPLDAPSSAVSNIRIAETTAEQAPDAVQETQTMGVPGSAATNAPTSVPAPASDIDVALAVPSEIVAPETAAPPHIGEPAPEPPQPATPEVTENTAPAPTPEPEPAPTPEPEPEPVSEPEPEPAIPETTESAIPSDGAAEPGETVGEEAPEPVAVATDVAERPIPETGDAGTGSGGGTTADGPAVTEPPETDPTPEQEQEPEPDRNIAAAPQVRRIGVPVGDITNQAPGVTTNRLPRIGDPPDTSEVAEGPAEASIADPAAAADGPAENGEQLGALARNRVAFDAPDGGAMLSVILRDEGATDGALRQAALELPFPVSFAVSVADPDAGSRAAAYRSAGFEVLMVLSLPGGAQPSDIEVAFESASGDVPDAVAVLDSEAATIAQNRAISRQIAEILAESGHGLVVPDRGLNAARQVAERNGVASALIFRSLESGEGARQNIRRMLDRAAFRAQQEGAVVVTGRLDQQTLTALAEWAVEDRAAALNIAPISAILDPE